MLKGYKQFLGYIAATAVLAVESLKWQVRQYRTRPCHLEGPMPADQHSTPGYSDFSVVLHNVTVDYGVWGVTKCGDMAFDITRTV